LAPVFAQLVEAGGLFIGLVKPQFESMHEETEGGLVVDEEVRLRTVAEVEAALEAQGFQVTGCIESPIPGKKKGNIEYLVRAVMRA
jgi:23S rRNA (cytidine1920-2'-O)/16S rRNA (cytidine1409-2'-O)-methyltransferase